MSSEIALDSMFNPENVGRKRALASRDSKII